MMSTTTRWTTAILMILALMAIGCGGSLPPISVSFPPPSSTMPPEPKPEPVKPRATLAFEVVDACSDQAIETAFVAVGTLTVEQANKDGYVAFELEAGGALYNVQLSADGYASVQRNYQLKENRQFAVKLTPLAGCKPPAKPEPPKVEPPPVVTSPVVLTPLEEAAGWSDEQWRVYVLALVKRNGELVNDASMKIARPDLVARGADFQNGWRGDLRPRVFLPVAGCPSSAIKPDALPCAYNRTVDIGSYGSPWEWIKR